MTEMNELEANAKCSINGQSLFVMVLLCLLSLFGSCSSDDPAEIIPATSSEIYFTKSLDFNSDSGEATLTFTTNKSWTIEASQSNGTIGWCSVTPASGKAGENSVKVRVNANEGYDDRNVTLILTAAELSKSIVVTQKQKDALTLTTAKYEVDKDGGTIQVEVNANISYEAVISANCKDWIHKGGTTRGLTTSKISFTIDKSEEYDKREGEITIQGNGLSESLKVYQTGGAILLLSQNDYTVSDAGERIAVELSSNFEYEVQMPQVAWINVAPETRGVSSHTLYYDISPNVTYDSRTAEIIYYDKNGLIADTLRVRQVQNDAILLEQNSYDIDYKGGIINVKLNTNVDVVATVSEEASDWISVPTTRGLVEKNYTLTIAENESYESRVGSVTFTSDSLSETITINQEAKPFLEVPQNEYDIICTGGTIEIAFNSNMEATFTVDEDCAEWITVPSKTRSIEEKTLKVSVAKNTKTDSRSGVVTITVKDIKETIKILQEENYLEITVPEAGVLNTYDIERFDNLKINGNLNGTDVEFVRYWAGKERDLLHLLDAQIVEGGGSYYNNYYTKNNSIEHMFIGCEFKQIILPRQLTSIDSTAFMGCQKLNEVKLSEYITSIDAYAFYNCYNLEHIVLPKSVIHIENCSFEACHSLQYFTIPENVTKIGWCVFRNCKKLKSISIPIGVSILNHYCPLKI